MGGDLSVQPMTVSAVVESEVAVRSVVVGFVVVVSVVVDFTDLQPLKHGTVHAYIIHTL